MNRKQLAFFWTVLFLASPGEVSAACSTAPGTSNMILLCLSPGDFFQAVAAAEGPELGLVSFEDYPLGLYPNGFNSNDTANFSSSGTAVAVAEVSGGGTLSGHVLRGSVAGGMSLIFQPYGGPVSALGFNAAVELLPPGTNVLVMYSGGSVPIVIPSGGFIGLVAVNGQKLIGNTFLAGTVPGGIILIDNLYYPGAASSSQGNPIPPVPCPPGTPVGFCYTTLPGPQWYDPPATSAFRFTSLNALFTAVNDFPTGFDAPFTVSVGGQSLGAFGPGQSVLFPNGTQTFVISGISPTVDGGDPLAFPIKLSFDTVGATFVMEPIGETEGDKTPPVTTATTVPEPSGAGWHTTSVQAQLTAQDEPGGSGVDRIVYTLTGAETASAVVLNNTATISIGADGLTVLSYRAIDRAGNEETAQTLGLKIDKGRPDTVCSSPNTAWHGTDVSIACTASDAVSGLANASDASFSLTTAVPAGVETANALTNSRAVCDVAGNCVTAGPVGGSRVDKKAPVVTITSPAATTYVINQAVPSDYACSDGGSGVSTCVGPVGNGASIPTGTVGTFAFAVSGTDRVMNSASASVSYAVKYGVRPLYDPLKPFKSGRTAPIRLQLVDAGGANVSAADAVVTATAVRLVSLSVGESPIDAGSANPDNNFRFDAALRGYIYNLRTTGLTAGTYVVDFTVAGDSTLHSVPFQIK